MKDDGIIIKVWKCVLIFLILQFRLSRYPYSSAVEMAHRKRKIRTHFRTVSSLCIASETEVNDSSVGIATRYGLDGPQIESRWGRNFPAHVQTALGPIQPPIKLNRVSFPEVKRPGRGANHPPQHSTEVKKSVELYLYSPSVLERTLPFTIAGSIISRNGPSTFGLLEFEDGRTILVRNVG
jgi:hypothetical protein